MSRKFADASRPSFVRTGKLVAALVVIVVVVVVLVFVVSGTGKTVSPRREASSKPATISLAGQREFAALSAADTDACRDIGNLSAIENYINSRPEASRMQGSCCSPMDLQHFTEQVNGLKAYASIPAIPPDPYDVSKTQSVELLGFYNNIQLDQTQQNAFDMAQSQTADHGWCCCQCWAWYTHAGLAKYVITQKGFDAGQTSQLIDLEDCCGGAS